MDSHRVVVSEGPVDVVAPETVIVSPEVGVTVSGDPLVVTGLATDESGIASVSVRLVRDGDPSPGLSWEHCNGVSWQSAQVYLAATVSADGSWELSVSVPAESAVWIQAFATDVFGNSDPSLDSHRVTVA